MIAVRVAVLCGLALATAAPLAQAQTAIPPAPFADANKDGKVSLSEYQTSRRNYLMKADRDRDGQITRAEWDRYARNVRNSLELDGVEGADQVGRGGWWEMIDAYRNGVVTPAEIDAMTGPRFARFDANHDGLIQRSEAEQVAKAARAAIR